jgi:RNA recognition motif-containing protein
MATPTVQTTKVFVGNLAFKTTETELLEAFKKFGTVADTKVIRRGRRSLGYGFVDFVNEDDAKKAVEAMDHKDLDGRALNVELAKPRQDEPADQQTSTNAAPSNANTEAKDGDDFTAQRGGRRTRGTRGGRGGRGGARGGASPSTGVRGGRGGRRGGRGGARGGNNNNNGGAAPATNNTQQKKPREQKPAAESAPSKTTLFVANLPFAVDNVALAKIFDGFNVTQARVVTTRNGRSRGYGFVTLANEEEQQKALKAVDNKEIQAENGPRVLSIKVAREQEAEQAEAEAAQQENKTESK